MRLFFLCFLAVCFINAGGAQPQQKLALIVAVSDYAPSTDWPVLHTEKDVEMIRSALLHQGFLEKNIHLLQGELATYSNIRLNLEQLLIKKAQPGDVVFFHFSGHGQQVMDLGGDELDGKDESIVPYDAGRKYLPGIYEGQNHLTDDTLAVVFKAIRQKIGPTGQLLAVIDACHSGTGLRSVAVSGVRGTIEVLGSEEWKSTFASQPYSSERDQQLDLKETDELGSVIAFFGSKANEPNFEYTLPTGEKMGSLSYAFSSHFTKAVSTTSYKGLFEKIRREMAKIAPTQSPSAEGNLDYLVLNGTGRTSQSFFRVEAASQDFWVINGGQLQGLTKGSVIGFFEAETSVPSADYCLQKTTILESDYLTSRITMQDNKLKGSFIYLLEQSPGDLTVEVRLEIRNQELKYQVAALLQEEPQIKVSDNAACVLIENDNGDSLFLCRADYSLIKAVPSNSSKKSWLPMVLKQHGRAELIRKMESDYSISSSSSDFRIEVVPVQVEKGKVKAYLPIEHFLDPTGAVHFPAGTKIRLRVSNPGKRSGYFNLLNIQSDDVITVLFPESNDLKKSAEDYFFNGGVVQFFELPREENNAFTITKPFGVELLKLIVSKQPIDLRWLSTTRGPSTSETLSDLDDALSKILFPPDTARSTSNRLSVEKLYFYDYFYKILPPLSR
jgi:hypothetical protein